DGLLNDVLLALGIISAPLTWLSTDTAIYIGIVYTYLPFMVLPIYATLEKMDENLLEAAADLGTPRWKAFWLVTLPLALPGVLAWFNLTALALGLTFLYLPIVILVIYSFNASRLVTVWGGWSTRWYVELWHDQAMLDAAWVSLRIAALSASAATIVGTLAALA